jgi:hypothetical protein
MQAPAQRLLPPMKMVWWFRSAMAPQLLEALLTRLGDAALAAKALAMGW